MTQANYDKLRFFYLKEAIQARAYYMEIEKREQQGEWVNLAQQEKKEWKTAYKYCFYFVRDLRRAYRGK